jgi:hypothetical protein
MLLEAGPDYPVIEQSPSRAAGLPDGLSNLTYASGRSSDRTYSCGAPFRFIDLPQLGDETQLVRAAKLARSVTEERLGTVDCPLGGAL